ncbi:MAG: hypothetical protein ACUVYA_20535 [Planctomycetota bacterium]
MDSVDLVVGIVLLVLLPIFCLFLSAAFGVSTRTEKFDFRQKPDVDPPPEDEEVALRFQAAQRMYAENGKRFLEFARNAAKTGYLGTFRECADRNLREADSAFQSLEAWIRRFPESTARFSRYLSEMARIRSEIERDLGEVKSLDVLGQGSP